MNVSFRPHWLLALALPLALIACGNDEPKQRAAFTEFLQTRIVDKPGVRVPKLTAEESKSFGDYTRHYAVISDFNGDMDTAAKPLSGLLQKGAVRSLNDVIDRREDIKTAQAGLNDMGVQLKEHKAKADSAHAQLKQPDDLKVVYDKAYAKTVSVPADTFLEVLPQINGTLDSSLKVADYVTAHKEQIDIKGPVVTVKDPNVQAELNTLLQELNSQAQAVQKAQQKLQGVMLGR
ncbi:DUF3053 domain-containing protein [Pseudomonas sp. 21LCFQ02]|uniref:DUF3053 domain-containing protein n=1 Tax=unclassified Pseudomonas TaxID=196821 RepID=UPI0004F810DE|nr:MULTISPECIES: DUF3053 domain-containing protein [unclassified Pseudomonas]MCO8164368.1 DUF3053 domain-containing protein [Pseudomonas sp. 21LCFQ010]MCO8170924.1 DUF3053 domain-containing protein [Pseudomonas sp. 21LCFQ02]BAP45693.1 lipoprotein [Pseudomonas sp. StFLB209]